MRLLDIRGLRIGIICLGVLWLGIASAFTPEAGDLVTAKEQLPLRNAPPQSTYFVIKGKQVDSVRPGERVMIEETKKVKGLFTEDTWIKIKRDRPNGNPESGWVYFGRDGRGINFEKRN